MSFPRDERRAHWEKNEAEKRQRIAKEQNVVASLIEEMNGKGGSGLMVVSAEVDAPSLDEGCEASLSVFAFTQPFLYSIRRYTCQATKVCIISEFTLPQLLTTF
jgi:hypothetical protein